MLHDEKHEPFKPGADILGLRFRFSLCRFVKTDRPGHLTSHDYTIDDILLQAWYDSSFPSKSNSPQPAGRPLTSRGSECTTPVSRPHVPSPPTA